MSLVMLCLRELSYSSNLKTLNRTDIPSDLKKKVIIHYLIYNYVRECDYCQKFRRPLADKYNPIKKTSKWTCRNCFKCNGKEECNGTFKKYIIKCQTAGYVCATCGCECCMGRLCGMSFSMAEWAKLPIKTPWISESEYQEAKKRCQN